jgi:hypothetical protein
VNLASDALRARRAALIEQIAQERDQVETALRHTRQRIEVASNRFAQVQALLRHPVVIAAVVVGAWILGWQRSTAIAKNIALGWSAWRRISQQ